MKKAIILTGVSGAGKTFARTHDPELVDLPVVDIADVYRVAEANFGLQLDWYSAHHKLLHHVRRALQKHNTMVVEGYYLPGSETRKMLLDDLKVQGVQADIRVFWAPLKVCLERIAQQFENSEISAAECKQRIELTKKLWRPQEEQHADIHGS